VEGKMDSLKYQEILGENIMPSLTKLKLRPSNRTMIPSIPQFHQGLVEEEVLEDSTVT